MMVVLAAVLVNGSVPEMVGPNGPSKWSDLWVGHAKGDMGETTSARVGSYSRVVVSDSVAAHTLLSPPPNPNIGDRTAHLHNHHQRHKHAAALAAVAGDRFQGKRGAFKEEWLQEAQPLLPVRVCAVLVPSMCCFTLSGC